MDYRTLEITVQHAKDLSNVNLFSKMEVYAVVSIAGGDKSLKQKTKTPVDNVGNTNPTWNFPMKFTVDEAALQAGRLTLDLELVCQRALGDKHIGVVHVPIKELLDTPSDAKQFVSYQVRKPTGKPKGQLHFSYQFALKLAAPVPFSTEPVMAYPAGSSSAYPPPAPYPPLGGGAPPPAAYPPAEGKEHYPTVPLYPPVYGGVPSPAGYPAAEGKDHYPPAAGYPPVGGGAPPPAAYPPQQSGFGGYPPPPPSGYGYPPAGYGYPPPPMQQQAKKKNKLGMGMGLGAGLLGGLLIGDMVSDVGDFGGGFDC